MEVTLISHPHQQITCMENARAYEAEDGSIVVLAELLSLASSVIEDVRVCIVLKGELAELLAIEEVEVGNLYPEEQRPIKVQSSPLGGDVMLVQLYLSHPPA